MFHFTFLKRGKNNRYSIVKISRNLFGHKYGRDPIGEGIGSHHLEQYDIKSNEIILLKTQNSLFPSMDLEFKEVFLPKVV